MGKRIWIIIALVFLLSSCQSLNRAGESEGKVGSSSKEVQLNENGANHLEKAIGLLKDDLSFVISNKNVLRNTTENDMVETSIVVENRYESTSGIYHKKTRVFSGDEEQYSEIYTDSKDAYIKYNDNKWIKKSLEELKTKFDMNGKAAILNYLENIKSESSNFSFEEENDKYIYSYIILEDSNIESEFLSFIFGEKVPEKTDSISFDDFKCRCEIYKETYKVKSIEVFLKYRIKVDDHENIVESERTLEVISICESLKMVLPDEGIDE